MAAIYSEGRDGIRFAGNATTTPVHGTGRRMSILLAKQWLSYLDLRESSRWRYRTPFERSRAAICRGLQEHVSRLSQRAGN
jgi:hypothetical protein